MGRDNSHMQELPCQEEKFSNCSKLFIFVVNHGQILFVDLLILARASARVIDKVFRVDTLVFLRFQIKNRFAKVNQANIQVNQEAVVG